VELKGPPLQILDSGSQGPTAVGTPADQALPPIEDKIRKQCHLIDIRPEENVHGNRESGFHQALFQTMRSMLVLTETSAINENFQAFNVLPKDQQPLHL
jgi:hypothetical protein